MTHLGLQINFQIRQRPRCWGACVTDPCRRRRSPDVKGGEGCPNARWRFPKIYADSHNGWFYDWTSKKVDDLVVPCGTFLETTKHRGLEDWFPISTWRIFIPIQRIYVCLRDGTASLHRAKSKGIEPQKLVWSSQNVNRNLGQETQLTFERCDFCHKQFGWSRQQLCLTELLVIYYNHL